MSTNEFTTVRNINSWKELVEVESQYAEPTEEWVFRGESREWDPPLQSTLERLEQPAAGAAWSRSALEIQFFNDFKRSFRIHTPIEVSQATNDDVLYWLSLMRHFGTPTRLVDFSYSLFIATFFALEGQRKEDAVVWLISKTWLTRYNVKQMMTHDGEAFCIDWGDRKPSAFRRIFWDPATPYTGAFPVNPDAHHQRLHLQQGLFLCPVRAEESFEDNLKAYSGWQQKVLKLRIKPDIREEMLLKLHRAGTNHELLFPGLDGFAQGLQSKTPVIQSNLLKLSASGARVATDQQGRFEWQKYYDAYCKHLP